MYHIAKNDGSVSLDNCRWTNQDALDGHGKREWLIEHREMLGRERILYTEESIQTVQVGLNNHTVSAYWIWTGYWRVWNARSVMDWRIRSQRPEMLIRRDTHLFTSVQSSTIPFNLSTYVSFFTFFENGSVYKYAFIFASWYGKRILRRTKKILVDNRKCSECECKYNQPSCQVCKELLGNQRAYQGDT